MEKLEFLCTIGGMVKWYNYYRKQYSGSSKKLHIELQYHPATPLLGIYLKELKAGSQRENMHTQVQPKPSTDDWISKMRYNIIQEENLVTCYHMDEPLEHYYK